MTSTRRMPSASSKRRLGRCQMAGARSMRFGGSWTGRGMSSAGGKR